MCKENKILLFVQKVNEELYEKYQQDFPALEYWTNGVTEGITIGFFQLWSTDDGEFDVLDVSTELNNYIKGLFNLKKTMIRIGEEGEYDV